MAELEINVVTEGEGAESSENPTLVVSDYSLIHHTDYSNTIIAQNANNASVVSIFPLRHNETEAAQTTQPVTAPQVASTPISTGGSAY